VAISTININAANGVIDLTGTVPFVGYLTLSRPFNQAPCTNSGLDARVTNSNPVQSYTGITLTVTNNQATASTLVVYLADRVTTGGASYYVLASAGIPVAGNSAVTQTLRWADLTPNCTIPNAAAFDSTQILAIGLGFNQTGVVNLAVTNVVFSTT
jgi:hypothetical protein